MEPAGQWKPRIVVGVGLALGMAFACLSTTDPGPDDGMGPEGGTFSGPDGASVSVPAGALEARTAISIAKTSSGAPSQPAGATAAGDVFALTPHGQTFAAPVTISIPFTGAADPALQLMTASPGGTWSAVAGTRQTGSAMEADVTHFSYFAVMKPDEAIADAGTVPGPLNGSWLVVGFVCDGGVLDAGGMLATTFVIDGGAGAAVNDYCTVPLTIAYPADGQVEWTVGEPSCPGMSFDGGQNTCAGTKHPSTYVVAGTTLTMTEDAAPACEYVCGGMHKVTTFHKQ